MSYHYWGDKDFNWDELYNAQRWIANYVKCWSRCSLISKEKYGTIRYEYIVPPGGHVMCYKFAIYRPWKRRVTIKGRSCSYRPLLWSWNTCWIYRLWERLGWKILKKAVFKAVEKWPHLKDELLEDLASNEKLVGKKLHDQYWSKL